MNYFSKAALTRNLQAFASIEHIPWYKALEYAA